MTSQEAGVYCFPQELWGWLKKPLRTSISSCSLVADSFWNFKCWRGSCSSSLRRALCPGRMSSSKLFRLGVPQQPACWGGEGDLHHQPAGDAADWLVLARHLWARQTLFAGAAYRHWRRHAWCTWCLQLSLCRLSRVVVQDPILKICLIRLGGSAFHTVDELRKAT